MSEKLRPHVALVGLMGAGKTVVGAALSRKSTHRHIDLDRWIQNTYGRSIGVIFEEKGEDGFRKIETDALKKVLEIEEPIVLSTGGGVVVNSESRAAIKESSYVIWLKATPEGLAKRVGDGESRPLLKGKNPLQVLQHLSAEREELYEEAADFVIDVESGSVREISGQILALNILRGTND
ncbi:MAG: Shikimate kinase [Acidimicrobiales bacterium AG-410-I20]|nr:MAG: Shikimate kinase [Acidimicrobiales bacterium AG-410-I20]